MRGALWALIGAACVGEGDYVPTDDTAPVLPDCEPPTPEVACGALVLASVPPAAAEGVYAGTDLSLRLALDGRTEGEVALRDASALPVAGRLAWSEDGREVMLQPDALLQPDSRYTWGLTRDCCGFEGVTFTTSSTGVPVQGSLGDDGVYALDPAGARVVAGSLVRDALGAATSRLLLRLTGWDSRAGTFRLDLAGSRGDTQDLCAAVARATDPLDYADPTFSMVTENLSTWTGGQPLRWRTLSLSGALAPQAAGMEGVRLAGRVEVEGLRRALDLPDDDAVCDVEGCAPCAPGDAARCVDVDLRDLAGGLFEGAFRNVGVVEAEANALAGSCTP